MSPELDQLLCKRYPALFAQRRPPKTVTSTCWGSSCDDGWFDLINELCAGLQSAADAGRIPQPVVGQVKQKFGTLRFYVSEVGQEASELLEVALQRSAVTCEICGEPGVLRWYAGVKTLCDLHGSKAPVVIPQPRSA